MTQIGQFFWYSIPQEMISLERVRRAWRQAGLNVEFLPSSRKAGDVAAEACSIVDRSTGSSFLQIENSRERLLYQLTVGTQLVELTFNKETAEFQCLDVKALEMVRSVYGRNESRLSEQKQRKALRSYLLAAGAEDIRSWVYFMPENVRYGGATPQEILDKTWKMIFELYGQKAEFHSVPIENSPLQITFLQSSIARIVNAEMDSICHDVGIMLDTDRLRKWRRDRIETIIDRQTAVVNKAISYANLLGDMAGSTQASIVRTRELVDELISRTETPVIE